jgi:hypothetical protein
MIDELIPEKGQTFSREQAIEWFARHYPKIKRGTITAHLAVFSTNHRSRVHHTTRGEDDLLFQVDRRLFRRFDAADDPPPIHSERDLAAQSDVQSQGEEETPTSGEFAYEADLRDFLAKNLGLLEPGLRLYSDESVRGVEFPAGGRFIDILVVDSGGALVVVELKVSRGYDRVVGQLLRYMAWIEQNLAEPNQRVRGIIIGREITEDLKLACSHLPEVSLFEYDLSVSLKAIKTERRGLA